MIFKKRKKKGQAEELLKDFLQEVDPLSSEDSELAFKKQKKVESIDALLGELAAAAPNKQDQNNPVINSVDVAEPVTQGEAVTSENSFSLEEWLNGIQDKGDGGNEQDEDVKDEGSGKDEGATTEDEEDEFEALIKNLQRQSQKTDLSAWLEQNMDDEEEQEASLGNDQEEAEEVDEDIVDEAEEGETGIDDLDQILGQIDTEKVLKELEEITDEEEAGKGNSRKIDIHLGGAEQMKVKENGDFDFVFNFPNENEIAWVIRSKTDNKSWTVVFDKTTTTFVVSCNG